MPVVRQNISGWGNCPTESCLVTRPESRRELNAAVASSEFSSCIPRGLGRSYGDSALNREQGVISLQRLNRLLAFDDVTGIVECEAGVSLHDLVQTFLPRGWFLPTTPGTQFVTIGGAVAADVHGKNHHVDGSLGNFVESFELLTADGTVRHCTPAAAPDLFWATVGGMGLTGVIISVRLRLVPVESAYCRVTYQRCLNADQLLEQIAATGSEHRYSVAWVDGLARGSGLGRSVLMSGNDAAAADLPATLRRRPLALPQHGTRSIPGYCPGWTLNAWSVKAFNAAYYAAHPDRQTLVDRQKFFYPLDHVQDWNRIYGRRGFVQYQALFPHQTSRPGIVRLLERISASRRASFLAVLKSSGAADPGWLSFLYPGHTLALDFPNTGADLRPFLNELDRIVLDHGGRLYLAKDAMTSAATLAEMYPRLPDFRELKAKIDPQGRFASSQARRLGMVTEADQVRTFPRHAA